MNPTDMAFDLEVGTELARMTARSTVELSVNNRGGGCGIIWDRQTIVTNAHVLGSARKAQVKLHDGSTVRGEVMFRDEQRDLAEVRFDAPSADVRGAAIGRAADLRVGDIVAAFGAPLGIAGALTLGIVHRKPADADGRIHRWIEADVRLAPGNSGGPLMDARGRVVGVNSMIAYGLALAVPSESVTRFLRLRGDRSWLGITAEPVRLDGTKGAFGLLIAEVAPGGPAARAGIVAGDVLVSVEGRPFDRPGVLENELGDRDPGTTLRVAVVRGGAPREIVVTIGSSNGRADRAA
ncbi:MAG TPA: trypsin-like peptidase domain-containing protein [Candidatus Eremiobacteraceae bacterium]|nr:trypsin-like peptidase domain-containing protein [Candidatus Eremiobacteraceae bacterium]